jgi:hypothetical protein
MIRNARTGFRSLRRTPGFAVAAILTLALGIGLSTAVFTIANALLLRRLPVRDQDRIVLLWGETRDKRFRNFPLASKTPAPSSATAARSSAAPSSATRCLGASRPAMATEPPASSRRSPAALLRRPRRAPALGRTLTATDDQFGAEPVAVLSYSAWQRQFGVTRRSWDDASAYTRRPRPTRSSG